MDRFGAWLRRGIGFARKYGRRLGGRLFFTIATIIAVAVLFLDGKRLLTYTFRLDPGLVLLATIISFIGLILLAVPAWRLLLTRFGSHLNYVDDLKIYCYSTLGIAIPGSIWPLVGRVTLYEREGVAGSYVTIATMIELILMGVAGLTIYGLTTFFLPVANLWQRPMVVIAVTVVALILIQPPILNRLIAMILHGLNRSSDYVISLRYRDVGRIFILEILTISVGGTAIYTLLQGVAVVPASFYVVILGAWAAGIAASNLFFWFPGKPLLRDGTIALILTQVLSPSLAITFALIIRVWSIASVILMAGLTWLLLSRYSKTFVKKI